MKKIFKIASLLLCASALVVYTGCTKESGSGDVAELTKKVDKLSEQINSQAEQISALQGVVSQLESAQKTLETDIQALQAAKVELENKKADKTQIDALNTAIEELQKAHEKNAQDIAKINVAISDMATMTWANATFATLGALQTVSGNLGNLEATVKNINEVVIPGLNTEIGQLKTDVKKAADDAASALGKIEEIEKTLKNIYLKGEVDAAIKLAKDELNETINAKVKALEEKDSLLAISIAEQTALINNLINAVNAKADQSEVDQIKSDLAALQKKVDESVIADVSELLKDIKAVKLQINGIASRVSSIAACPTLTEEFAELYIGNTLSRVLCADFEIKPADKVDEIIKAFNEKKSPVSLRYSHARSRNVTKASASEISINQAMITDLRKNDNGTLRVIATRLGTGMAESTNLFYSLGYEDKDSAGVYSVISDYTEAIKASEKFVLDSLVQYANIDAAGKITFLAAHDKNYEHETRYNYVAAETATHQPWVGDTLAFNPNVKMPSEKAAFLKKILNKDAYTFQEATNLLGTTAVIYVEGYTSTKPVNFENKKGSNTTINFVPEQGKSMYEYVSEDPYYAIINYRFNGVVVKGNLVEKYYITKIEHPVVTLPDTTIYWNYKQYWNAHRHVTIDFSKARQGYDPSKWNEAIDKKAEVTKDFIQKALFRYQDITSGYQPLTVSIDSAYYEYHKVYAGDTQVLNECVKENKSDKYTFRVTTRAKKALIKDVKAEKQTVTGHITKADTVVIKNFVDLYIKNSNGAIEPSLIDGLKGDDILYANVQAAFLKQFKTSPYIILTGAKNITDDVTINLVNKQDLRLVVKPGIFAYDQSADIVVKYQTIFGRTYTVTQPITTTSPKFKLEFKPLYVESISENEGKSVARGKINDKNEYSIEDIYYAKYVKLTGDISDEEAGASFRVHFKNVLTKNYGLTTPEQTAVAVLDKAKGDLDADPKLVWSPYKNRQFDMTCWIEVEHAGVKASVLKSGQTYEKIIHFTTPRPVKVNEISAGIWNSFDITRVAGQDYTVKLYENIKIYGYIDDGKGGKYDETANLLTSKGTFRTDKYYGCEMNFTQPDELKVVTGSGATVTIKKDVDYQWPDNKSFLFLKESGVFKDGIKSIKIEIPVQLTYILDNNKSVSATGTEHSDKLTGVTTITIKQE